MASGVQVDDQVKDIISDMKVVKSDADANERIRLVVLEIKEGYIKVESIFREKDLSGEDDIFKFFLSQLDKDKCRYMLYDCHFETKESSRKEELVFVMWAPETAPIKSKMQYASSKDSLKKVLTGIKHELQMNDLSDYGTRDQFAAKISKNVIKVEGHDVK
ncbi:cofilin-2 [Xiphophorus maculatus]|uniref:Cofilin-2 n=1 Tax=Xiphophorus maculatus TaxID=8083 RepID=A0A3B5Q236_XIPMA|nr:cofilin-2 [Xiphophorus maculatus]XP_027862557.1 cofilin-2-like [Xiphophorus couchianus]XP_032409161.1 cofilin-2-like [Xiphophorus hellerii]